MASASYPVYASSSTSTDTVTVSNSVTDTDNTSSFILRERKKEQWRKAKLRRRTLDADATENDDQRMVRLDKERIRSARYRSNKTEHEKQEIQKHIRLYKVDKRRKESRNQRFWRLLKRREYRRKGYHNSYIQMQYESSIGKYGKLPPKFKSTLVAAADVRNSEEDVTLALAEFDNLLTLAEKKIPIPASRFEYFEKQLIDIPCRRFFHMFLEDEIAQLYGSDYN